MVERRAVNTNVPRSNRGSGAMKEKFYEPSEWETSYCILRKQYDSLQRENRRNLKALAYAVKCLAKADLMDKVEKARKILNEQHIL